jgi:hypothetical protein
MTIDDIKVGQTYKWVDSPEYNFTIVEFDGKYIIWEYGDSLRTSYNYNCNDLINAVNKGNTHMIGGLKIVYKMDKFKFV